jgi:hypothetical protein
MKVIFSVLALALTSNFAAAGDTTLDDLVGKYYLQRQISGFCYRESNIRHESFTGTNGPGIGIYGELGRGEIVFQFSDINLGRVDTPVIDMNTGEVIENYIHEATAENGRIAGETIRKDRYGNTLYQTAIAGRLAGDTFTFRVETFGRASECVYKKVER